MPVHGMNEEGAKGDDENNDRHFDNNDGCVRARALADSIDQEHSHGRDDQQRRQINRHRMSGDHWQGCRGIIRQGVAALFDDAGSGGVIVYQPQGKLESKEAAA